MNRSTLSLVVAVTTITGLFSLLGLSAPARIEKSMLATGHDCSSCHLTHNGKQPSLLIATNVEVMCLTCHGPGGVSTFKARNHVGQTCTVCHDPHDGQINRFGRKNLKMLRADVVAKDSTTHRPLTFESRGTDVGQPVLHSFCDNDLDGDKVFDNVCDTCHRSSPDLHKYTSATSHRHNPGRTCTVCHTHQNQFKPND